MAKAEHLPLRKGRNQTNIPKSNKKQTDKKIWMIWQDLNDCPLDRATHRTPKRHSSLQWNNDNRSDAAVILSSPPVRLGTSPLVPVLLRGRAFLIPASKKEKRRSPTALFSLHFSEMQRIPFSFSHLSGLCLSSGKKSLYHRTLKTISTLFCRYSGHHSGGNRLHFSNLQPIHPRKFRRFLSFSRPSCRNYNNPKQL